MRKVYPSIGALATLLILIGVPCAGAQNWPGWRGANRDGKVTGFTAPAAWPAELTLGWKVTVGAGDASPALVGDKIYVFTRQGGDEVTQCLNVADGKPVWTDKNPVPAIAGAPDSGPHAGPRSSPAVGGGRVVTLGTTGNLSCLDAATGKVAWRKNEIQGFPQFHTAFSPIIVDGLAIAHLGGTKNGALVAYALASGDEKWKWTGEGPSYASAALMTVDGVRQLVTLTDKSVVGIGLSDGKTAWQIPFAPRGPIEANAATPVIDGTTVIYTGDGRGMKAVKIEKQGGQFVVSPPLWSCAAGTKWNTPVLKDGLLYGITERGNFFCVNARDGQVAWTDTQNVGPFGNVLDAGALVLALPCGQGTAAAASLYVIKPDGAKYHELAKIKVAGTEVYASPVVAGNRVFVKDRDSLALLVIK